MKINNLFFNSFLKNFNYLVFHKFLMVNIFVMFFLLFFYNKGYLDDIFIKDSSRISLIITILCFIFIVYQIYFSFFISSLDSKLKQKNLEYFFSLLKVENNKNFSSDIFYNLIFLKLKVTKDIANMATVLGLMGTVIGFIYVLIYLDTNALKSIETLPVALEHISKGLGIALYTTLVGTFFNVWMTFNFIYLNKEVEKLILKYSLLFEKSNNHSTT